MPPKKKQTVEADQEQHMEQQEHQSQGEVAIFQPPRLPYHPAVEERFHVDKGQWKVLVEAIFPSAKSVDAIVMALSYCQSRKLDVMKRPVHIVPMYDSARGGYVETVWPGISELRTTASRTKGYAGVDEAEFGATIKKKFTGRTKVNGQWTDQAVEVEFPEWCRLTVYRIVDGQRCKFVGPKVKWEETYAAIGASDIPNKMWQKRTEGQLEKCAEAAALRRAFPEELGNELTAEEMMGRNLNDLGTIVEAVAEPAGMPSGAPPQTSAQPGQRDAAPPRQAPAAKKDDPISSGPQKDAAPPRQAATEPPKETKSARSETVPHQIPGKGESYESWTIKYCDLIATSEDMAAAYKWIEVNADPLTRLEKGRPSEFLKCKKAAETVVEKFRAEAKKKQDAAAKKAAPAADMDGGDMEDGPTDGEMEESLGDWPAGPEDQLKRIEMILAKATGENLEQIWNDMIEDHFRTMFPPDQDEAMAIFRRHEARVAP